ncbi:urate oxidase [Mangrovactinospora gilvigrisea]|uniref:Uricase n=1 Tax=Mangrovactinospora gilvigrisea TaxID=1428644 RepID=A0A1J7BGA4_9ACTN|nr:urate oxidase [Mangrovactinospora gilvigrisea]OIV37699.1 urate oxidase [Mangrovactinospora gilvigrisea]
MPAILGQNQYGKAEVRIVRLDRATPTHRVKDLNVSVALRGDLADTHLTGDNSKVLTTDATKNTVYALAKKHGIDSTEAFGLLLARHFVDDVPQVREARIRLEEYHWDRIPRNASRSRFVGADEIAHSFVRNGTETRTAQITYNAEQGAEVLSGIQDLVVMNSTDSEFWGFYRDEYTTLKETRDRILATQVTARWRHNRDDLADWDRAYADTRRHLLEAFSETYSYALQQTLYQMGARVIEHRPDIDEVRLSLPNKHHFEVDLEPFGMKNGNEVFYAADRPYGLIEGTILRDGAEPRIPVD